MEQIKILVFLVDILIWGKRITIKHCKATWMTDLKLVWEHLEFMNDIFIQKSRQRGVDGKLGCFEILFKAYEFKSCLKILAGNLDVN